MSIFASIFNKNLTGFSAISQLEDKITQILSFEWLWTQIVVINAMNTVRFACNFTFKPLNYTQQKFSGKETILRINLST